MIIEYQCPNCKKNIISIKIEGEEYPDNNCECGDKTKTAYLDRIVYIGEYRRAITNESCKKKK